ncbi:MAG TPA: tRNA (adenosine(37)-N6)-threonylcarbamoyltransferase complex dimerization subunit type 1 TsaB [Chthoniobacterales bacterium]|nr:tRNA (adenosine(37)-N6)-threonylcarbamoyltransferase complex dimerization subunit type 1 TsaB [Chthoniobacterales bacterium]
MKILALELSTACGSLAWVDDSVTRHAAEWPNDRKNSGPFFERLEATVQQFGTPDRIVVGLGPGSYAGIRIAISAAIGIGAGGDVELIGYPSVCALKDVDADYAVIGDARRHSFFFVRVSSGAVAGDYELLNEKEMKERLNGSSAQVPTFSSDSLPVFHPRVEQRFPSAEVLAQLTVDARKKFFLPPLEPIYLREPNITMPKPLNRGPNA